ncbi:MAG: alpha/beta hydrolase [Candidatus Bathyarchaeia archaeon]
MGFVTIDGLKIHYLTPCDPSGKRGHRIMYIHGTGYCSEIWRRHMDAISDSHTPVAIDLPGHGLSEGRGFRGTADYSNFVVKLAESLGWGRFVIAGHSLGGAIAITTAVYNHEMLKGMILIDTGARLRVHPDILKGALSAARSGKGAAIDPSWAFAKATPNSVIESTLAMMAKTDPWVTYNDWICDDSFDFTTRIKDIHIPTVAICGEEDKLTPVKYHSFLKEKMPNCTLKVIEGAGHFVMVEKLEEFTRAVKDFLNGIE